MDQHCQRIHSFWRDWQAENLHGVEAVAVEGKIKVQTNLRVLTLQKKTAKTGDF